MTHAVPVGRHDGNGWAVALEASRNARPTHLRVDPTLSLSQGAEQVGLCNAMTAGGICGAKLHPVPAVQQVVYHLPTNGLQFGC